MTIIYSSNKKVTSFPDLHDPNDEKYYTFVYRPKVRANTTEYLVDDVVVPSVANGLLYECVNPGISAAAEPTLSSKLYAKTTDGTVVWVGKPYNLLLNTGDNITDEGGNVFSASVGVVLVDPSEINGVTSVKVQDVGALETFRLTNTITVQRANGTVEVFERSIDVKVGEL